MTNKERADNASAALSVYIFAKGEDEDPDEIEANITDLVTDLLHLAKREAEGLRVRGIHEAILHAAAIHFEAEA